MTRRYRKERDCKTTNSDLTPPEVKRTLQRLSPRRLWEVCRPIPVFLEGLTEEEKSRAFQESRIHVFELLTKRFGLGVLELREDTLHPLGLKLE